MRERFYGYLDAARLHTVRGVNMVGFYLLISNKLHLFGLKTFRIQIVEAAGFNFNYRSCLQNVGSG